MFLPSSLQTNWLSIVIWWNKSFSCGCYLTYFWFQANLFISRFESLNLVISSFSIDRQRLILQGLSFNLVDLWFASNHFHFVFRYKVTINLHFRAATIRFESLVIRFAQDLILFFLFLIRFHPQGFWLLRKLIRF